MGKPLARALQGGFTLLELLVVLLIVGLVSAGVVLSLPDPGHSALQKEGRRLSAVLEAARAESRSRASPVVAQLAVDGLRLKRPGRPEELVAWLQPAMQGAVMAGAAAPANTLILGPEPLIPPQRLRLWLQGQSLDLYTDGVSPFALAPQGETP